MATVIDSLLVTLGLDATDFKKGNKEVQKSQKDFVALTKKGNKDLSELDRKAAAARAKNAKEMQAQGKKAVETFVAMRNQALSLLAVFTAGMGIVAFAKNTVFTSAALGRLSQTIGISIADLGGWKLAAEQVGGSADGMLSDLERVSDSLALLRQGKDYGPVLDQFFQQGGQLKDSNDVNALILSISDLLHDINATDPAKALNISKAMGFSPATFQILKQGSAAVREQIALNAKLAGVTQENADIAMRAEREWANLATTLTKLGRDILFPLLEQLNTWMTDHQDEIVNGIKAFVSEANEAAKAVGGWKNVLAGLIALKVASIVAPLVALGAALVQVGAGLASVAKFGSLITGGLASLLFSKDLNSGEDAEMAKLREQSKPSAGKTRGMRNNNPGNIRYGAFAKAHGAVGQDAKGFAIFPDMALGEYAGRSLLGNYLSNGHDTIRKVISRYAPSSENDTAAYIAAVSKRTGIGADQRLNQSHIASLTSAIFRHENGAAYSGSSALSSMTRNPRQLGGSVSNSTSTSEVHIGQMTINTQATDARGIAGGIRGALNNSLAAQANSGMP